MSSVVSLGLLSSLKKIRVQCISTIDFDIVLIFQDNQFYALNIAVRINLPAYVKGY